MSREAYIIDAVRTPIGRGKPDGWLHGIHPVDLLAMTLDEVTRRAGCPKEAVDDVVAGCVTPAGDQASDVGRLATLKAGFPIDVPGVQINRFCGSGQQAIHFAAAGHPLGRHGCRHRLRRGEHEPGSHVQRRTVQSGVIADFPYGIVHQGISAEMLVDKWGLSREALDEYALQTHCRAAAARAGWSQREMTPVGEIRTDQGVRANPDPARLAALPGVFRPNGAITAVNSSQDIRWRGSSAARFRPESRKCCKNG